MGLNTIRLQAALKRAGLRQMDLADAIGVQPVTISRYINGHREPHPIHLQRMAYILHVSPEYLTSEDAIILTDNESLLDVIGNIQAHAGGWTRKQKMGLIKLLCDFV